MEKMPPSEYYELAATALDSPSLGEDALQLISLAHLRHAENCPTCSPAGSAESVKHDGVLLSPEQVRSVGSTIRMRNLLHVSARVVKTLIKGPNNG